MKPNAKISLLIYVNSLSVSYNQADRLDVA